MKKIAMLLALALLLGARAEEDTSVIAAFDGGYVYFNEVFEAYETASQLYALMYGDEEAQRADIALELQRRAVDAVLREKLLDNYASALNAELINAQQLERLQNEAREEYQRVYRESLPLYLESGFATEEEAIKALEGDLKEARLDYETYLEDSVKAFKTRAALALLGGEVSVSEEELLSAYAQRLAEDKASYSQNPQAYPYDCVYEGANPLFVPEGVRLVRVSLIDAQGEKRDARGLYGAAGDAAGVPICANCALFDAQLLNAALALKAPGDVSETLKIGDDQLVCEYISDVKAGVVPFEAAREALFAALYSEKQQQAGTDRLEEMLLSANVRYYLYRLG